MRLAVSAQEKAGVSLITDGEQRRDSYSSFVGGRLSCCRLVPVTDLLPYVDDPEKFRKELEQLDIAAEKVHHPALIARVKTQPTFGPSRAGLVAHDHQGANQDRPSRALPFDAHTFPRMFVRKGSIPIATRWPRM